MVKRSREKQTKADKKMLNGSKQKRGGGRAREDFKKSSREVLLC